MPVCVLVFFALAPVWLNHRLHTDVAEGIAKSTSLSAAEKAQRTEAFAKLDFQQVCAAPAPNLVPLRDNLEKAGVCDHFERLRLSLYASMLLMAVLLGLGGITWVLNQRARRSADHLISSYRLGWRLGMVAALVKLFLLVPLLAYGCYELTTLAFDMYVPKLIVMIVILGVVTLWRASTILLRKVRPEFPEAMAREVTPAEAPELWAAVREAAARLQTAPPDRILVGMQLNFYVTELAVLHDGGRAEGRTLFLSQPLLKQLTADEIVAIIGHELGHFIGEDTRLTREFYPMRMKAHATLVAMAQAGWVGRPSAYALHFFSLSFGQTERTLSRERELLADRVAADLTSPSIIARALVKFHAAVEALNLGITGKDGQRIERPFDTPMGAYIQEKLVPRAEFWTELFARKTPHPLDSHPALGVRLEALGEKIGPTEAQALATASGVSAYDTWFTGRDELFAVQAKKAEAHVAKIRARMDVAAADVKTESGKQFLEQHFPEKRWPLQPRALSLCVFLWGGALAAALGAVLFVDNGVAKASAAPFALLAGYSIFVMRKRHRSAELVLRADSVIYTGWNRPLLLAEVEKISATNSNGMLTVNFQLKQRAAPYWQYSPVSWVGFKPRALSLNLYWLNGKFAKQKEILDTIFRYQTRQIV